jgi:hypothetical protein
MIHDGPSPRDGELQGGFIDLGGKDDFSVSKAARICSRHTARVLIMTWLPLSQQMFGSMWHSLLLVSTRLPPPPSHWVGNGWRRPQGLLLVLLVQAGRKGKQLHGWRPLGISSALSFAFALPCDPCACCSVVKMCRRGRCRPVGADGSVLGIDTVVRSCASCAVLCCRRPKSCASAICSGCRARLTCCAVLCCSGP